MPLVRDILENNRHLIQASPRRRREAFIILSYVSGLSETHLISHPETKIPRVRALRFKGLMKRRLHNVPLSYITGRAEFWSLSFKVNHHTLIPRPETECLIEKAFSAFPNNAGFIADIGTGCGNLAVVIGRERPRAAIFATDISRRALRTAKQNARRLGATNIHFLKGDLLRPLDRVGPPALFDLIISNPPYVSSGEWTGLSADVKNHEPKTALWAGPSGTEVIKILIQESPRYLKEGGRLLLEIGFGQEQSVRSFFKKGWSRVDVYTDYAGIPRIVSAEKRRPGQAA